MKENNIMAKRAAAKAAADLIQDGMKVGLGTGSTAIFLVEYLSKKCQNGLNILAVATSSQTATLAKEEGIPLLDPDTFIDLDLTIDGADEVDQKKRLIKGRGGALVREKIAASASREMIVIVDDSKLVENLGKGPLPVEVIPFGYQATLRKIQLLGHSASLRMSSSSLPFITENGNYIVHIQFEKPLNEPEKEAQKLIEIPGVVETGFFLNLAGRVLVGHSDGHVDIL